MILLAYIFNLGLGSASVSHQDKFLSLPSQENNVRVEKYKDILFFIVEEIDLRIHWDGQVLFS